MDLSNLKLLIEKGPREGETIEFNSNRGLTIRIGRVARGNTIAIKDDGVSSKHLSIEWCSEGKWAVKDLDSSNGTFLNSSALPPHTVHDLRDGDELKIGEVTKIRVRISHVSDSQPAGRILRSRTRVLGAGSLDDGKKVAEEGNRRGRGRGRGRGKGDANLGDEGLGMKAPDSIAYVAPEVNEGNVPKEEDGNGRGRGRGRGKGDANLGDEGLGMEALDSIAFVAPEVNKEGNVPKEENGKGRGCGRGRSRGKGNSAIGDGGLGSEVSASIASANLEVDVESNVREIGFPRGGSREKKRANLEDEPKLNPEISKNVESVTQKGRSVSSRRTRSSKNDKAGEVECKAEPVSSLRRSTRSRGMKNKDELAFPSALERIPEAFQLVSSMNFEGLVNVSPTEKLNARTRRGRKKNEVEMGLQMASAQSVAVEDKRSEEEHNEGEQVSRESMHNAFEEGERLASGLISGQGNCNESEFVVVKQEPQSNIGGIVGKGESMSEIAQKDGDLACELNFEHGTVEEELEATLNQDDRRESECNVGATVSQESTAYALEKEAEVEIPADLNKMTLGEWFDHLEMSLPKQIRSETDQIIQGMLKRSQQLHEFMLQQ